MKKDLCHPAAPTLIAMGQPATTDIRFTVRFPDDTVLHSTTGAEDDPNVIAANMRIADRIEGFCGPVYRRQVGAVVMALSQSGLAPLNRGLVPHGVNSAEHAPVTYTLAKNPVNGASETLPVPAPGPAVSATVQPRGDGSKALVVPRDPDAASMFYRIDVED